MEVAEELLSETLQGLFREVVSAALREEIRGAAHRQAVARLEQRHRLQNLAVRRGDRSLSRPLP